MGECAAKGVCQENCQSACDCDARGPGRGTFGAASGAPGLDLSSPLFDREAELAAKALVEPMGMPPLSGQDEPDLTEMYVRGVAAAMGPTGIDGSARNAMGEAELAGLNFMLKAMWPYLRKAIERRGKKEMLERAAMEIEKRAEFQLKELEIDFDPGETPPVFLGVRTYKKNKTGVQGFEGLQIDAEIEWKTENFKCQPKIKGTANFGGTFEVSVQDFSVVGLELSTTASTVLAPLVAEEPCFGAAQIFFLDLPDLKMRLNGWNHHRWVKEMVMGMMQRTMITFFSDSYVLPHRMVVKARPDIGLETMISVKSPLPIGLLEIEVCEARNLLAMDVRPFVGASSDPFVKVGIGEGEIKTSTVNMTTSPKWDDGVDYLPVYDLAQVVKVSVWDADVVGIDFIGHMDLYTVYSLWKEMQDNCEPDGGRWFRLTGKNKANEMVPAGEVKLKVRFLKQGFSSYSREGEPLSPSARLTLEEDVWMKANAAAKAARSPRLLTVKLLGLEGEAAQSMQGAFCTAEYNARAAAVEHTDASPGLFSMFRRNSADTGKKAAYGSKSKRFFSGSGDVGMPTQRRTGKAKQWAAVLARTNSLSLPPEVVRAIEHLRYREKWDDKKIAAMFGISEDTVHSAAELRASFEVVWHEALHFVQHPDENPFDGSITVSMHLPRRVARSQLHIDKAQGRVTDKSVVLANAVANNGLVGSLRLSLNHTPLQPDTKWSRRVRARLRRPEVTGAEDIEDEQHESQCKLQGEAQCDETMGKVVPGLLIEFMVEIRPLEPDSPEEFVEDDQAVTGRNAKAFGLGIEVLDNQARGSGA